MKYEWARPLWKELHLPLDRNFFGAFWSRRNLSHATKEVFLHIGKKKPYSISREDYQFVQMMLWEFVKELNERPEAEIQFHSRIELNYLWLE